MKVLIVRSFPNKLNLNSYNVQEIGLAKALKKQGTTCDIVFYNGLGRDHVDNIDGIKIYWLKAINIFKNGIFLHLKKLINEYDVIQVHEYDQLQSWLLYTAFPEKVIIYHGPYYDSFNKGYNLKCKVFDTLFLPFSKKAKEKTLCLTKSHLATDFLKQKGFKNVKTAGVGLNTDTFSYSEISASSEDTSKFRALYVGKLEERRNIEFLLSLAKRIHQNYEQFSMTIIGKFDSPEYKEKIMPKLSALIDNGIITYTESATQKELPALYSASDVFIFTSNYEIFGMVLLEAMFFGAVPISTHNGGAVTLIDNGVDGYILDNNDEELWLNTFTSLMNDKELLSTMKKNAHQKIADHFTWEKLAQQFSDAYEQVKG